MEIKTINGTKILVFSEDERQKLKEYYDEVQKICLQHINCDECSYNIYTVCPKTIYDQLDLAFALNRMPVKNEQKNLQENTDFK